MASSSFPFPVKMPAADTLTQECRKDTVPQGRAQGALSALEAAEAKGLAERTDLDFSPDASPTFLCSFWSELVFLFPSGNMNPCPMKSESVCKNSFVCAGLARGQCQSFLLVQPYLLL